MERVSEEYLGMLARVKGAVGGEKGDGGADGERGRAREIAGLRVGWLKVEGKGWVWREGRVARRYGDGEGGEGG
eukprot:scaffold30780_cov122-Amphora_coffeaeformis.AAC.1